MTEIIKSLTEMMTQNLWAAPVLSLVAGILTSFTPCSLASVPMLLACVGAVEADRKKAVCLSLSMASGMAVTFGIFGSVASFIGHRMHEAGHWWTILMGITYDTDGSSGIWRHQSDSPYPHIRAHDEKRLHRRIFYRSSGRRVCFPLCDPGNGCPAGACCGAGAECLVGRFAYGALCGGSQVCFW